MDGKSVIFILFASLVQRSIALPLIVNYGLSADELAPLTGIIVNQEAALKAKFGLLDPIFDLVGKYASALIWNVEAGSDDDSSKIAQGLASAKEAIDYTLDAILITLQESCDAVEVARNETYADLDYIFAVATEGLALSQYGNYSANQPQLEVYRATVQENFKNLVASIYDSIRTCLATTDVDTLNLVQKAQNGSGLALAHVTNALFNAYEVYSAAVTVGTANASLISEIEDCRRYAHIGFREDVENKFSALKTIYIGSQLDDSEILSGLAANQYALTGSFYRFRATIEAIIGAIFADLKKIALGLSDAGSADFSLNDAAQAAAVAEFKAAHKIFLASFLSTNPDASEEVAAAEETLFTLLTNLVALYFDAIAAAQDQNSDLSDSQAKIEDFRNLAISNARTEVDVIYNLIRNGETWDDDSEVEFTTLQGAAADRTDAIVNSIINSTLILLEAADAGSASVDDFYAIASAAEEVIAATDDFTQGISAAGVVALEAAKANYVGFEPDSSNAASAWNGASSKV